MAVMNTVLILLFTAVNWICSQEFTSVNQTVETFEGCDIELIPPEFNDTTEWVTWAKGTTANHVLVYHVTGKRIFVSPDQCDLQGEYHVKDTTLGLSISNLDNMHSDVFFFSQGDQQYSFGLHVTELNKTILNKKLEVKYGDSVLASPATLTVALNSDVTLTATTSEVKDAETPVITLTSDVAGQMGDNVTSGRINITGHSIQFKPNTSQAEVATYTFVSSLCAVFSDSFDVTVVVLEIVESDDLCDFVTVSREKVSIGWPFDMETISIERRSVSGESSSHQVIPQVAVTTEDGRLLKECADDQTCSFSVEPDDLEYNEENDIIITASVAGFEGKCKQVTVLDYTGLSDRGIGIVAGSAAALVIVIVILIIIVCCCCCCKKRRNEKSETHF